MCIIKIALQGNCCKNQLNKELQVYNKVLPFQSIVLFSRLVPNKMKNGCVYSTCCNCKHVYTEHL